MDLEQLVGRLTAAHDVLASFARLNGKKHQI